MKKFILFFIAVVFASCNYLNAQESNEIKLPDPQMGIGKPLMQALKLRQSSRGFDTKNLSMQELSNLLWAADGINRPESGKRTSPSAHNWQEIDIYVVLENGTFLFNAEQQSLIPIGMGDNRALCGLQGFVATAPLNLVYVSNLSKMTSGDNETKIIWTSAAAGFCIQNVYLYCASQGLSAVVRGMIDKPKLAEALKLQNDQIIILSQTVGYPEG